ncbi:MAG: SUMF1/EgtB/PvdO family nonheme iron enzyme [Candidatus Latescibacter sp.]|nr:SUMF1/EgtB/PvdO family nonheme iron enzyme [Candidatus Latescibacter sp.]
MKRIALSAFLLLSFVLILSCGKGSKTPTAPLEDTYTISGTVTGADSVTVTLSGDASASWTVKKSGESYSFTLATGGTYTITPSKSGFAFTPSDNTIKNLSTNLTQNFDAKLASYTLSGTVTGADSVTVTLSGGSSATWMVTKSGGTYSFNVPAFGTYTVTPNKKGYVFTPQNTKVENLVANHVQNFEAIPLFALSGTVTGANVVTVTLSGDASDTQTVNSGGTYSFTVIYRGNYTVTPSKRGYVFNPPSKTFTNVTANVTQDFTAKDSTGISFVSIPGGTFQMGDEVGDLSNCLPVHTVTVSSFQMSVYEITNAQYANYLNEAQASGDVTATSESVKGAKGAYNAQEYIYIAGTYESYIPGNRCWITYSGGTFSVVSGKENWPVVYVTWYGSKAFALYYGLDLPTEAEWEYACRGGKQYKYGTDDGTISSTKANYDWGSGYIGHPVNVGSYPKNPFGLYDMSGNVWEWCHDRYGTYPSGSENNPSGVQVGSDRIVRGGGWSYGNCRSSSRNGATDNGNNTGFRIVRRASPQNY